MKNTIKEISGQIFSVSIATYIILLVIEIFQEGFVSNYFDLSILLWIILGSGCVFILLNNKYQKEREKEFHNKWFVSAILAIVAGLFVYFKFPLTGLSSLILPLASAAVTFACSYLI